MAKKLNIESTRIALQNFDFASLFREELGWSAPKSTAAKKEVVKDITFTRKPVAELSGAVVFEITLDNGALPDSSQRKEISKYIRDLHFENVCIFVDKDRSQSIWHWEKKQDKKMMSRDHFYMRGQPGDLFIAKLSSLVFDLSDFDKDGNVPIAEVAGRMKAALDVEVVTKKFYKSYQDEFNGFLEFIEGISDENDRKWYASVILNRLMFIYFLQRKFFLDNGDADYLSTKLDYSKKQLGKNKYYDVFLKALFFEGFAKEEKSRTAEINKLIGKIKYLNGGLFLQHKIEKKYNGKIKIADKAFENLLELFKAYSWNLNDTPGGQDNELNPDVLGYIFEKYINQKAFGAYYTRTEITEYLCEQTVYKLILDAINGPDTSEHDEVIDKVKSSSALLSKPTPLSAKNKDAQKRKRYERIEDLLIDLNADICRKLVVGETAVLPNLSLLDPACGSGAFLVAAMKTLINVYAAILGKIKFLGDKKLIAWLEEIEANHPSVNYYIKKQIITNNLYGVDIMEEASEIAKLRLFLALVASAQKVDDLEPLPNIDFNIMTGNSLIGLMRVDENEYNKHQQGDMFKKSYSQLIQEREAAIRAFKSFEGNREVLQSKKEAIDKLENEANQTLNLILGQEFHNLGIKYEQQTWDERKKKLGKSQKRAITIKDIQALNPFHWGYEFSQIFRKKNGFDAIIANPPWEIFKPTAKEFFKRHSASEIQRKMRIEDFEKEKVKLLANKDIREAWLKYLEEFPHVSHYYRKSEIYKHQVSTFDGKKTGSDINLYKLFLEQSFNLLKDGGYCGIIVPSGVYLDAGNTSLRTLLFEKTEIENIYGISNEKFLFEEVEHNIKYALVSFKKGKKTNTFNVCFRINPREAVGPSDIDAFLHDQSKDIKISLKEIRKLSPVSLAIPELKNGTDFDILNIISNIPILGDRIRFGNEFHMTNDSDIFETSRRTDRYLPVIEGKMIHQFNYLTAPPRYWVNEIDGRDRLLGRTPDTNQIISYQLYRIGFRAIARATDSRTMIATLIPPNSFTSNSLAITLTHFKDAEIFYYLGIFNSLTFDYILRSKISSNLNFFYIQQMQVGYYKKGDELDYEIAIRVGKLVCLNPESAELWNSSFKLKWSKDLLPKDAKDIDNLRAELDSLVAIKYNLKYEYLDHITKTFPVVSDDYKNLVLNKYSIFEKKYFKVNLDQKSESLTSVIQKGEHKQLEFKSTMFWDVREQAKKYHIEHSVLKTIAAFLNSEGGTLLIGVTDDGQIHGLEDDFKLLGSKGDPRDNFNKAFDNLITNNFGNAIHRLIDLTLVELDGKHVAKVVVKEKAPEEVFLANKDKNSVEEFYVRQNSRSIALMGKDLTKYIKEHWK